MGSIAKAGAVGGFQVQKKDAKSSHPMDDRLGRSAAGEFVVSKVKPANELNRLIITN